MPPVYFNRPQRVQIELHYIELTTSCQTNFTIVLAKIRAVRAGTDASFHIAVTARLNHNDNFFSRHDKTKLLACGLLYICLGLKISVFFPQFFVPLQYTVELALGLGNLLPILPGFPALMRICATEIETTKAMMNHQKRFVSR